MFVGLFTNVVFGFVRSTILLAAVRAGGDFGGYDAGSVGAYVWISQGLLGAVQIMSGTTEIGQRIKSGDVAVDFIRPIDIQASYLAADLDRAAFTFLPRGLPSVAIGGLTFGLAMPTTPGPYLLGLISVLLAVTLSFLMLFVAGLAGFWIIETRGIHTLYAVAGTFLAGLYVPVHIFPGWLQTIAHATPFPSLLQAPIDVLSGRVTGMAAVDVLATQFIWVVAATIIGRLLLRADRRKLEVQGG
jgi:ABC-2 type transport system permease protein